MSIVTIAVPPGFEDPNVDPATAPVWVGADGTEYLVASGLLSMPQPEVIDGGDVLDGAPTTELAQYESSDPIEAQPDRINVVVGMDGLSALAAMGLTPVPDPVPADEAPTS